MLITVSNNLLRKNTQEKLEEGFVWTVSLTPANSLESSKGNVLLDSYHKYLLLIYESVDVLK